MFLWKPGTFLQIGQVDCLRLPHDDEPLWIPWSFGTVEALQRRRSRHQQLDSDMSLLRTSVFNPISYGKAKSAWV